MFIIKIFDNFLNNIAVQGINAGAKHQLHIPTVSLLFIQKGAFYSGIKIFNAATSHSGIKKMSPQDLRWH
jgi:ATP-dependent protease Clp ATPase subunit